MHAPIPPTEQISIINKLNEPVTKCESLKTDDEHIVEAKRILDFVSEHSQEPKQEVVVNPKVMLSTEIAALTGKEHKNVVRDIRIIVKQLNEDGSNLSSGFKSTTYVAGNGKNEVCYELDYEATMIVMTGYDVVARAKVIKRWQELEKIAKCEQHFKTNEQPEAIENNLSNWKKKRAATHCRGYLWGYI